MGKYLRRFLAASVVLTFAPTAASALPPPRSEVCFGPSTCNRLCSEGLFTTTCRAAGLCEPETLDEPTDEADMVEQFSEESLVCSAEAQASALES
ncbi:MULTISPECIES: hypothetical protein [Myxococcus]|uniref:hypothetical protein n=1 Tax=Myxococcus TaxID=32 RepID=UPI0013D5EF9A|nr:MULTISPECIES: hypothetical protein [Myxococcus]NVJ25617.1 hypothetical protein [Myxococcus sp. AM011]